MSDIIRLLPDSVANQIAAGEVIQRPASVIKELVENAVDAGATSIQIIIKDAGRTLIQVVDNGKGMSDTDARMAFERHATSKISQANDLFALNTMGFRGEALASIAAVAQVDMRTMQQGASIGTRILINGSKVESQEPEACVAGCNMMVKNLFYNIPARRKFLKKDAVELGNIMREFERLALVNPNIDFTLVNSDTITHQLLKSSQKQRIVDLFGKVLDKQLIPVETETSVVKISGFVGLPQYARKRNPLQYLFVNGRNMRHPCFHKAITGCYEMLIPADEQPNYFLNFTVDPATIDVNIHPTKNEIKFENESVIWQILVAAVKESLGRYNAVPGIDFDADDAPDIPAFAPNQQAMHGVELDRSYNPFAMPETLPDRRPSTHSDKPVERQSALNAVTHDWERLYDDFASRRDESIIEAESSALNNFDQEAETTLASAIDSDGMFESDGRPMPANNYIQVKNRYILSSVKSGLMVIDQHRAHVKVLFERYMDLAGRNAFVSQKIMFPEVVRVSPSQNAVLSEIVGEITALGFDVAFLGDDSWSLNGVPSVIDSHNPVDMLLQIIDNVIETGEDMSDQLTMRIALSMARAAAVKSGQMLQMEEMERLTADLFALPSPNYTPDGKLIINIITLDELSRPFA